MQYLEKQPFEELVVCVDFANVLATGETISTPSVVGSAVVLVGAVSAVGTQVRHSVEAGVDGVDYNLSFRIVTSNGNQFEEDVRLSVREGL